MAKRGSNIYKRKDGRFEGRVPVGYQDNGKIKYKSVYARTLAEVKEKMSEMYHSMNCVKNWDMYRRKLYCSPVILLRIFYMATRMEVKLR